MKKIFGTLFGGVAAVVVIFYMLVLITAWL